ncbi:MAG: adenylate/guanylate cyclase domain-containing protein [Alphaproteobacteria bacterium]|nr:adenylate/guanylate cyclase domain-containing protein [Alphaproteobacteria bacterium]
MAQRDTTTRESALAMAGLSGLLRWLGIVPWAMLAFATLIHAFDPGNVVESLRTQVFDFYQRASPRPYVNPNDTIGLQVRYVDIDEESIKRIGQWPWPRSTVAKLVRNLGEMGTAVVAFDIVFAEADNTSPEQLAKRLPPGTEWDATRQQLSGLPRNDAILTDAIKSVSTVTGFAFNNESGGRAPRRTGGESVLGDGKPLAALPRQIGVTTTMPELEEAAAGNGSFNVVISQREDLVVRKVPLLFKYQNKIYPSLTLEVLRVLTEKIGQRGTLLISTPGTDKEVAAGNADRIISLRIGDIVIPTTENAELWLHYTDEESAKKATFKRAIPAWQVLDGTADRSLLESSAVFIGTSAPGLLDLRPTPTNPAMPGVEVHVQALEQMLLGHHLERPDFALGFELIFATLIGLGVLLLIVRVPVFWIASVAILAVVFAVGFSWYAFTQWHWLVDPIAASVNIALVFASASLVKFMRTEAERRTVRSAFAQYLPPDVVESIANDPSKLKLGGETRELSIMFCDIRGFTPIAESFRADPQGLTKLINRALTPLSREVLNHHGTIDKYIGDCVMAFWNAPLDDADHATHACECALAMMDALIVLNQELTAEGFYKSHKVNQIDVSIGLNTGTCVVGNMGSELRFDYSALGDAVNISARIQSFAGNYGFPIAIGEDTEMIVNEKFAFLELDYIAVKGRATPTHIYALMGHAHVRETKTFQDIEAILQVLFAAFRSKDWAGARDAIARGRSLTGAPAAIFDTYESRINHYEHEPPPKNWDGAWSAKEK